MADIVGLLKVKVIKGYRLAVRDIVSSDPYVVVRLGGQTVKTRVIKSNLNPVWDDELTLSVHNFNVPLKLQVFDKDTFSADDKMGDAEIDLQPLGIAVGMKKSAKSIPDGSQLCRLAPSDDNCLVKESCIHCIKGNIVQEICIRLQHVETGEVELQLKWIDITN